MNYDFIHSRLPKGAFRPRWDIEYYKLKARKKRAYPDNIELREGYRHLVWSRYAKRFYERVINDHTFNENLAYYLQAGWLYLWPSQETLEEIRQEMQSQDLTYRELMWRRYNEYQYFIRHNGAPTGNGDLFWQRKHRENFQEYLKKKNG